MAVFRTAHPPGDTPAPPGRTVPVLIFAAVAALGLVGAACGGGGDGDDGASRSRGAIGKAPAQTKAAQTKPAPAEETPAEESPLEEGAPEESPLEEAPAREAGAEAAPVQAGAVEEARVVELSGRRLAPKVSGGPDAATGAEAPVLKGGTFAGERIQIGGGGRPQVVIFVAHWCPFCRREVPVITKWLEDGGPEGVDIRAVVTATDKARKNYPPSAWLARERWPVPTLADDYDHTAAQAYGLTAFPFYVALDADGQVVARTSGVLGVDKLEVLVSLARLGI